MRTALVLLFLLAVAAVPGSLLPQRPLNPTKVDRYLAGHGGWGRLLDRLGLFDVFGTPWFAAIYLLLGISLVGCLVPRIRLYARAVRARPLPAPKHLARLPESDRFTVTDGPQETADALRRVLGRRWRTVVRRDGAALTVSAEKGYSREAGNLVFHVALLAALVFIAAGRLWGYSASVVVQEGHGFCNTVQQFDSWRPGRFQQGGNVAPFCVTDLTKFTASYLATGEPSRFAADVTYTRTVDGPPATDTITVNHPLRLDGDRVYLIGHGFAPRVTVRMPDGRVIQYSAPYIPQDPNTFLSEGAFQFQGPASADGKHRNDIGIDGFFAPTPVANPDGTITSGAPQARNPVLGVFAYQGDLNYTGLPRSVYSLDIGKMTKVGAANLREGQTLSLPGGATVTFDGYVQWASLQVSHDPTQGYLLIAAAAMVVGLMGSLGVRRRRVWIRLVPVAGSPGPAPDAAGPGVARTVVEVGGLARSDSGDFGAEFAALGARLRQAVRSGEPGPATG